MFKVAILDDYQNVSHEFVDLEKLSKTYEFKVFSEPFTSEEDAIEQLLDYETLNGLKLSVGGFIFSFQGLLESPAADYLLKHWQEQCKVRFGESVSRLNAVSEVCGFGVVRGELSFKSFDGGRSHSKENFQQVFHKPQYLDLPKHF